MRKLLLVILLLATTRSFCQTQHTISVIDFVQVKNGRHKEAIYYYENNWKVFRDVMLKKGFIKSYKLLKTKPDSTADFDLILLTEYADSTQFRLSEERFQKVIKETRGEQMKFLNDFRANDFRKGLFFKQAETMFGSEKKKSR